MDTRKHIDHYDTLRVMAMVAVVPLRSASSAVQVPDSEMDDQAVERRVVEPPAWM